MPRRNVIWIFGDQHRAQALGCTGNQFINTPNLDAIAPDGHTAIAGCPLCTPFRSALLTGQYPHRGAAGHDMPLPDSAQTVAHVLGQNGYESAYFGKWHVDGATHRSSDESPTRQTVARERRGGFDTWIGYENNNAQFDCWVHGHDRSGEEIERYKLPGYETDSLSDLLISYVKEQSQFDDAPPFFAALSVQPPHGPYVAPDAYRRFKEEDVPLRANVPPVRRVIQKTREDLCGYYAMIENLDYNVGRIRDALVGTGLADDTAILFFSDHGDMHGSHGQILKCSPYEESIRIPFLVGGGGIDQTDAVRASCPGIINHVDITATTLGLCGVDAGGQMDGTDYSGYFATDREKPTDEPDSAFLQLVDPGYTQGFAADRERPWRGVITNDGWKYAVLESQPWILFNLNEDPFELANLALDRRFLAERQRLQDRLSAWINDTGDDFELPDIS